MGVVTLKPKKAKTVNRKEPKQIPPTDSQFAESAGGWSAKKGFTLPVTGAGVYLTGMTTGCGLMQMYGTASFSTAYIEQHKEYFKTVILRHAKACHVGAIVGTLGEGYKDQMEALKAIGFEEISVYNNWAHGNQYKQHLFLIKVPKDA